MKEQNKQAKSLRAFIGAKDFEVSRRFYKELGFQEVEIDLKMVLFKVNEQLSFYLQDYYTKDWIDNLMLFLEVDDVEKYASELLAKGLADNYENVRFTGIKKMDWGSEIFMHDPSGVLWHFGQFNAADTTATKD